MIFVRPVARPKQWEVHTAHDCEVAYFLFSVMLTHFFFFDLTVNKNLPVTSLQMSDDLG